MSRKNEAKWVASANRWQINVQLEGRRRTFTSSIKGLKGKIAAEKKQTRGWKTDSLMKRAHVPFCWISILHHFRHQLQLGIGNSKRTILKTISGSLLGKNGLAA